MSDQDLATTAQTSGPPILSPVVLSAPSVNKAVKPGKPDPTSKFKTQMVLLQRKIRKPTTKGGQPELPHLLEIQSNSDWERIRSSLLSKISTMVEQVDYPDVCTFTIGIYTIVILPRPTKLTVIPTNLQKTLKTKEMLAIRVKIMKTPPTPVIAADASDKPGDNSSENTDSMTSTQQLVQALDAAVAAEVSAAPSHKPTASATVVPPVSQTTSFPTNITSASVAPPVSQTVSVPVNTTSASVVPPVSQTVSVPVTVTSSASVVDSNTDITKYTTLAPPKHTAPAYVQAQQILAQGGISGLARLNVSTPRMTPWTGTVEGTTNTVTSVISHTSMTQTLSISKATDTPLNTTSMSAQIQPTGITVTAPNTVSAPLSEVASTLSNSITVNLPLVSHADLVANATMAPGNGLLSVAPHMSTANIIQGATGPSVMVAISGTGGQSMRIPLAALDKWTSNTQTRGHVKSTMLSSGILPLSCGARVSLPPGTTTPVPGTAVLPPGTRPLLIQSQPRPVMGHVITSDGIRMPVQLQPIPSPIGIRPVTPGSQSMPLLTSTQAGPVVKLMAAGPQQNAPRMIKNKDGKSMIAMPITIVQEPGKLSIKPAGSVSSTGCTTTSRVITANNPPAALSPRVVEEMQGQTEVSQMPQTAIDVEEKSDKVNVECDDAIKGPIPVVSTDAPKVPFPPVLATDIASLVPEPAVHRKRASRKKSKDLNSENSGPTFPVATAHREYELPFQGPRNYSTSLRISNGVIQTAQSDELVIMDDDSKGQRRSSCPTSRSASPSYVMANTTPRGRTNHQRASSVLSDISIDLTSQDSDDDMVRGCELTLQDGIS